MNAQLHRIGKNLFSKDAVTIQISPQSELDFSKVCRTCLRETEDNDLESEVLYIIGCNGKLARLHEMFETATGLKITNDDMLPRHICDSCFQDVKNSFSYRCQSLRAYNILESVLVSMKDENPNSDTEHEENSLNIELHEEVDQKEEEQQPEDEIPEEFPEEMKFKQEEEIPYELTTEEKSDTDEGEQQTEIINFDEIAVYEDSTIIHPIEDVLSEVDEEEEVMMEMEIEQLDQITEQDENSQRVVRTKNTNQLFRCDFCNSVFHLQRDLIVHYRDTHPDEKPFRCDVCEVSFVHIQSMRRHKNTHAPCPKQKTCLLCNRSFSRADDLKRHMRTHTDERPYACSVCQKAFKQHTELRDHMLSHDDKKMYKCEPCNKEWRSRNGWYLHMKSHQDGRNGRRKPRARKFE